MLEAVGSRRVQLGEKDLTGFGQIGRCPPIDLRVLVLAANIAQGLVERLGNRTTEHRAEAVPGETSGVKEEGSGLALRTARGPRRIASMLDDTTIRSAFHEKRLRRVHQSTSTLIVDEFGIDHGRQRADIVVINGRMTGYEIKSDSDTLDRLAKQVVGYNRVFDFAVVVATERHLKPVSAMVPSWWGIISVSIARYGAVRFRTVRRGSLNPRTSAISLTRLLWRDEALAELRELGLGGKQLRKERARLYQSLAQRLPRAELARIVRDRLKARANWRDLAPTFPDDGLCPRNAMS